MDRKEGKERLVNAYNKLSQSGLANMGEYVYIYIEREHKWVDDVCLIHVVSVSLKAGVKVISVLWCYEVTHISRWGGRMEHIVSRICRV